MTTHKDRVQFPDEVTATNCGEALRRLIDLRGRCLPGSENWKDNPFNLPIRILSDLRCASDIAAAFSELKRLRKTAKCSRRFLWREEEDLEFIIDAVGYAALYRSRLDGYDGMVDCPPRKVILKWFP